MDLADVRLVALRHPGDLHVTDMRQQPLEMADQVAFHDLAMVEVELQPQVVGAHGPEDRHGLVLPRKEVARHVTGIDRLDQQVSSGLGRLPGGEAQVRQVGGVMDLADLGIGVLGQQPGHGVHAGAVQGLGIAQALDHRIAELRLAAWQAGEPALPRLPVTGRQVEQHLLDAALIQRRAQRLGGMGIGKQVFDPREAGIGGRREAVEEGMLLKQHAEVGGQSDHDRSSLWGQSRGKRASSSATCSGLRPRGFCPRSSRYSLAVSSSSSVA